MDSLNDLAFFDFKFVLINIRLRLFHMLFHMLFGDAHFLFFSSYFKISSSQGVGFLYISNTLY